MFQKINFFVVAITVSLLLTNQRFVEAYMVGLNHEMARELLWNQLPPGVSVRNLGAHQLKDITRPEQIFQVVAEDLPSTFPPPGEAPPRNRRW